MLAMGEGAFVRLGAWLESVRDGWRLESVRVG
jgi:hypothetical protein